MTERTLEAIRPQVSELLQRPGIPGVFIAVEHLPRWLQVFAYALPTTHAVTLMRAIWGGESWGSQLATVGALGAIFAACIGFSARWFRWE